MLGCWSWRSSAILLPPRQIRYLDLETVCDVDKFLQKMSKLISRPLNSIYVSSHGLSLCNSWLVERESESLKAPRRVKCTFPVSVSSTHLQSQEKAGPANALGVGLLFQPRPKSGQCPLCGEEIEISIWAVYLLCQPGGGIRFLVGLRFAE